MLLQELKDRRASMRGDATKVVEYNIMDFKIKKRNSELQDETFSK